MTTLTPFTFPDSGAQVRTVTIDGAPWFFATDVCAVLEITNVGNVLARLDDDEKDSIRLTDGNRGNPNRAIISEPGLYAVILRSDSPAAKPFRRWVTGEVLPALRRTGSYSMAVPSSFAEALELAAAQQREIEASNARVAELEPQAAKYQAVLDADGLIGMTAIADMLDVHVSTLTDWLVDEGLFRRQVSKGQRGPKTRNMPRRAWQSSGHFTVRTEHTRRVAYPVAYATSSGLDHVLTLWGGR